MSNAECGEAHTLSGLNFRKQTFGCSDGTLVSDHMMPEGGKEPPPPEDSQGRSDLNGGEESFT